MDIVRNGELEATNYFFGIGDQESVLELTFNHDSRTYELGTGYGHIAVGVDDLDGTLSELAGQGIEPERPPYSVREGGSRLRFVQDADGRIVDERYVDRVAHRHSVSLRTGCFCNPGAGEVAFTISRETLVGGEFGEGMTLDDYVQAIGLPSGGAVRASLGIPTNAADITRFAAFAAEFVDLADVPDDLPARTGC
jgi:hypothetical protein